MRIALYARVSTRDKSQDPETQLIRLREYASRLPTVDGFHALSEYVDYASGTLLSREQLDLLMESCRAGDYDMVMVQRIDRFGRSLIHLLQLLGELQDLKVDFRCSDQPIDLSSSLGKYTLQILGAAAEFERNMTVDRIHDGLHRARLQGKTLGRPRVAAGLPEVAEVRRAALGEITVQELQDRLSVSRSTAYRLINDYKMSVSQKP